MLKDKGHSIYPRSSDNLKQGPPIFLRQRARPVVVGCIASHT